MFSDQGGVIPWNNTELEDDEVDLIAKLSNILA